MKIINGLLLIIIMITGFGSTAFSNDKAKPLIIDVRTTMEWNNGHLDGAILIPYDQIGVKIGDIVKDQTKRIYVYCRSGRRSQIAKEALEKLGYKDIVNLGSLQDAAKTMKLIIVK